MDIEVRNVSKRLGYKTVLSNFSLTARAGEILCLLGPSGAGKTTLIRLMTGCLLPDEGTILFGQDGIQVRRASRGIGYMPQADAIYADISGLDNLLFFGRLYGLTGKKLRDSAEAILAMLDLKMQRDMLVAHFSGGMKKRLSLGIALLHDPQVLLLDEPTVGIDPVLRKSVWERFEKLRQEGKTIIVSTHVMDEAMRCQKAALIHDGRLIAYGATTELAARTRSGSLEELFFQDSVQEAPL